jgi:hypothetical protein
LEFTAPLPASLRFSPCSSLPLTERRRLRFYTAVAQPPRGRPSSGEAQAELPVLSSLYCAPAGELWCTGAAGGRTPVSAPPRSGTLCPRWTERARPVHGRVDPVHDLYRWKNNSLINIKCGLTGHFAWQYPTRSTTPGARNQVKPQGQQNFMRGKVNHMTSDEAQQAPDVVLGMFPASSHPATILVDSRASHSFISSSFVAKHSLPIAIMKHTMLVSSPGGEMRTKHICPAVSITIRG